MADTDLVNAMNSTLWGIPKAFWYIFKEFWWFWLSLFAISIFVGRPVVKRKRRR